MDVSALISKSFSNTLKSNERSQNDNSNFNDFLSKVSSKSNESTNNNTKYVNNSQEKSNYDSNRDNIKNEDSKPISKEVRDSLKEAGVSDKDIDKIKDVKDLKSFIIKKVLSEKKEDGLDISGLLAMLASLLNGKLDKDNIISLKGEINKEIQDVLSNKSGNITSAETQKELLSKTKSQFIHDILTGKEKIDHSSILGKIKKELSSVLNNNTKDLKNISALGKDDILGNVKKEVSLALENNRSNLKDGKDGSKNLLKDITDIHKDLNSNGSEAIVKNKEEKSSNYTGNEEKQSSSDEDFLKSLLSNNGNDKITKVTNFMTQFNSISPNDGDISELEKMVINKNNFNADMIKSLKYMETNNIKDLTIKITPKELGEIAINITMESGVMKATITASNKEAYNLLNTNLQDITNKLQNNDIKIQNLSLNLYNDDTTFYKDGSNRQNSKNEQKSKGIRVIDDISSDNTEIEDMDILNSNVNILA
ncbi:flagellar hook-length control protein FliK [Clostridium sp. DJ247]|uniref:flagellar hook-length control protein FliK n=1 Tax=Clostridium sp. DJ247 TaxID=2726188 RepID=UPI00162A40FC|nr:flagellar hook-length control protein FliK [Clostridium sp. DJ247]MBC2582131.1 hypothetical protein [Clostridium sp. DJ247]